MGSVLPVQFTGVYQAQINFLDQVRRLQRKSRPFVLQEMAGQAVQLSMHARIGPRAAVAVSQPTEAIDPIQMRLAIT